MKEYKVLYCDLDGTLIETVSGETFPEGVWDMKLRLDVFEMIKQLSPKWVFIVSNQGGIQSGYVDKKHFSVKMQYLQASLKEYLGYGVTVEWSYCSSLDKGDYYRKPNIGMLESLWRRYVKDEADKEECLMIGDASGKEGQFSDSDKKTAENFGIDYMDADEFAALQRPERLAKRSEHDAEN